MAEPARKLATELATDIVKRPAESLTTSGALKVGANKAGKALGKVAPVIGKGFTLGSLLLNSAPPLAEPSYEDIRRKNGIPDMKLTPGGGFSKTQTEDTPMWKQKVSEMKPAKSDLPSWDDIVNSQAVSATKSSAPVTTPAEQTKAESTDTKNNNENNDEKNKKQRQENFQPELPKEPKTLLETPAGNAKKATPSRLSYNNLYSYYKSGGFGDPTSSDAKRDFGFAILNTIGSGLSNAGRGIKGQGTEAGYWDKILAQGKSNQTEFEMLDKQLENNEAFQSYLNNLRKDFEDWTTKYGIKMGNDKEKMEALKAYTAAKGNQMENDWKNMLLRGVVTGAETVGTAYLMNRLIR